MLRFQKQKYALGTVFYIEICISDQGKYAGWVTYDGNGWKMLLLYIEMIEIQTSEYRTVS